MTTREALVLIFEGVSQTAMGIARLFDSQEQSTAREAAWDQMAAETFAPPSEPPFESPPEPDLDEVPEVVAGVPLQDCEERRQQLAGKGRRRALTEDPVACLQQADYWTARLSTVPAQAEEWTRCVECLPGPADVRLARAAERGVSDLREYHRAYDQILTNLDRGQQAVAEAHESIDRSALLDLDRLGRIRFWLGDPPELTPDNGQPDTIPELEELGLEDVPTT